MDEFWRAWAKEFEEAREAFGTTGALLYLSLLILLTLAGLAIGLVVAALAVAALPLALVMLLPGLYLARKGRADQAGTKPSRPDPWLSE